ncbi:DUF6221 family protein [Streptomyces chartreusis]|uniref:DUF6221 family protein n=1 Tax=Streptomyces chartreusis TaxID=1969 RepID=UPI0035DB7DCA
MDELVRWLGEQLDEDDRIARAATPGPWEQTPERPGTLASAEYWHVVDCSETPAAGGNVEHVARWDPSRALREIDAKRQIVDRYAWLREHGDTGGTAWVLPLLALPYADRPGYREEWRP